MATTSRRILALCVLALVCAACKVDVAVDVAMRTDGSGTITVTAVADQDIVTQAPTLATDLRLDDVRAAGWTVDGPAATADGGLQVVMTQTFTTPQEANAILAGLNGPSGPLVGITLARSRGDERTTFTLNGSLRVTGGLDAFTDADLLAAVGATPYSAQITAAGLQPTDAVGITFTARLPGTVKTSTATDLSDLSWIVPLDGTATDVASLAEKKDSKNVWASPVSQGALIALIAWCAFSVCFIIYVIIVRRRRAALRTLR
jgi:hypothetical protein